jgi:hypothetical protein
MEEQNTTYSYKCLGTECYEKRLELRDMKLGSKDIT